MRHAGFLSASKFRSAGLSPRGLVPKRGRVIDVDGLPTPIITLPAYLIGEGDEDGVGAGWSTRGVSGIRDLSTVPSVLDGVVD